LYYFKKQSIFVYLEGTPLKHVIKQPFIYAASVHEGRQKPNTSVKQQSIVDISKLVKISDCGLLQEDGWTDEYDKTKYI
jgi:hypothetical protein